MVDLIKNDRKIPAKELNNQQIKALNSEPRIQILQKLSENPSYPAKISEQINKSKQNTYYHFKKLEEAGIIEKTKKQTHSGGEANYYKPTKKAYAITLQTDGEEYPLPEQNKTTKKFLKPLIKNGEMNGKIIAGSPDQHGPDKVRARDGHLTAEIAYKLGNYSRKNKIITKLDTEIVKKQQYNENLLMIGGILTNVISKKFNENFPVHFTTEKFPYQEIQTPNNSYTEDSIGFIAKTSNPKNHQKSLYIIAGVQSKGTHAAVHAFNDLEKITKNYTAGQFYTIIRGQDLNSDGEIDDYKVIETSE